MKKLLPLILCLCAITRLQAQTGSADSTFAADGRIEGPFYSFVTKSIVQPDSKLIVATSDNNTMRIYRLTAGGALDSSFSGDGLVNVTLGVSVEPISLLLQPDGKIIALARAGFANSSQEFLLVRLNPDGSPDNSFDGDGVAVSHFGISYPSSAALDQRGRIVVGGVLFQSNIPYFMLLRVNPNGQLDSSFASNGIRLYSNYHAFYYYRAPVAIQPDGKILFGGTAFENDQFPLNAYLFRVDSAGNPDSTFGAGNGVVSNYFGFGQSDVIRGFVLQPDGRILVAEASSPPAPLLPFTGRIGFVRYHSDGFVDSSFGSNGKILIDTAVNIQRDIAQVMQQKDGKILLLGEMNDSNRVYRINPDGARDSSFATNGVLDMDLNGQPFRLGASIAADSRRLYIALSSQNLSPGAFMTAAEARKLATSVACTAEATLVAEGYLDIPGTSIQDLTTNAKYPNSPDTTAQLPAYEYGPSFADNYGSSIRAYVCPPVTGYYTFYITSNNQSQLWLSTDDDPVNIRLIAAVNSGVGFRNWTNPAAGRSQPVFLFAGNRYFIGTLHKAGAGIDHLSVGWSRPDGANEGPIPATYFTARTLDSLGSNAVVSMRSRQNAVKLTGTNSKGFAAGIFPNPSIDYFNLQIVSGSNTPVTVRIIDVTGKILQTASGLPGPGSYQLGHTLPGGFYFVEVLQGKNVVRLKVLKQ